MGPRMTKDRLVSGLCRLDGGGLVQQVQKALGAGYIPDRSGLRVRLRGGVGGIQVAGLLPATAQSEAFS